MADSLARDAIDASQHPHSEAHRSGPSLPGAGLARHMKTRHLVMMSLGSAIGTGLFVGSGKGIAMAGPAVLLAYAVASILVVLIMWMLGEMASADPSSGSISVFAEKAMGRTAGATLGWLWWLGFVVVIAAEATAAASIVHTMWPVASQWLLALIFMTTLTGINLLGVSKFGEMEFWFALLKICAIVVFLVVGLAILLGLFPGIQSPGIGHLFNHGGFMPTGVGGVAASLLLVVFAFGGMEIVTIAAAETENPERNISRAIRTMLWRIILFYVGSVFIMVTVLPWDSDLAKSPFVAVLTLSGLPGIDVAMALVIVIALLSSLNANLYGASRMIYSLSQRGLAPAALTKVSSKQVPRLAVLASVAFGFITVVLNFIWPETVLGLLLSALGSAVIIIWGSVIITQIILRKRAEATGSRMPYKMRLFPYLSYLAMVILAGIVVLTFFDTAARNQLIASFVLTLAIALVLRFIERNKPGT